MKRGTVVAVLALLGTAGCGGGEEVPPTTILCVWDSVDIHQLHAFGAPHETTPVFTELAAEQGICSTAGVTSSTSSTASFATLLTARGVRTALSSGVAGPEQHGLFSIRELGHDRIDAGIQTLAESYAAEGRRTLASVSLPQLDLAGLERGFDTWHAPEVSSDGRGRSAAEVVDAVFSELALALNSNEPVLLVLHFGDLRGTRWTKEGGHDAWLDQRLASWRGKGGPVDEAYAAFGREPEEKSLLDQLKTRLLRRRDDERREALLESIYGARLGELDGALGRVLQEVKRVGRYEEAEVLVCGGPSRVPGEADQLLDPGPRSCAPWVLRGNGWLGLAAWGPCRHLDDSRGLPSTEPAYVAGVVAGAPATIVEARSGWVQEIAPSGQVSRRRDCAQRVFVSDPGPEPAYLTVTAVSPDAELAVEGGEGTARLSSASPQVLRMRRGFWANIVPGLRGVNLRLVLEQDGLTEEKLLFGGRPFVETDVPLLLARSAPEWPEATDEVPAPEPLLDLQPTRGRRVKLAIPSTGEVRLLVELFPADEGLLGELQGSGASVRAHDFRPGAVWIEGPAPLELELPPKLPSARLALAFFLDGRRVPSSAIRYEQRFFGAPGELELLIGAGAWNDPELRGRLEDPKAIAVELHDPIPPPADYRLPTREERAFLRQLGDDE